MTASRPPIQRLRKLYLFCSEWRVKFMDLKNSSLPLVVILFAMCFTTMRAQEHALFTCFNAQEIHFPLNKNDFSSSRLNVDNKQVNALFYLYEDKYTFWYKFIAHTAMEVEFSVAPSNPEDRYKAVAFKYKGEDFCENLISNKVVPMQLTTTPIFYEDESNTVIYKNTVQLAKGDTIYVSVLSLNDKDCGHFLYIEAQRESLSMHAIHAPCYNFAFLEAPNFSATRLEAEDVGLDLDFSSITEDQEQPKPGYESLKTVEVQSQDDAFVSVGDILVLNKVFFYNNTYAFKPEANVELNQLVFFLKGNPEVNIEIQGHTANDSRQITPDPNFKGQGKAWNFKGSAFELSQKRAEAVQEFLIENGIDKKRLTAKGYGDSQKRIENAETFEEFEENMRVEILIIE